MHAILQNHLLLVQVYALNQASCSPYVLNILTEADDLYIIAWLIWGFYAK